MYYSYLNYSYKLILVNYFKIFYLTTLNNTHKHSCSSTHWHGDFLQVASLYTTRTKFGYMLIIVRLGYLSGHAPYPSLLLFPYQTVEGIIDPYIK